MYRFCRQPLAIIDAKVNRTFLTFICINQIFRFAIYSSVDVMCIASYVRCDRLSWSWSVRTLITRVSTCRTAAFPACRRSVCSSWSISCYLEKFPEIRTLSERRHRRFGENFQKFQVFVDHCTMMLCQNSTNFWKKWIIIKDPNYSIRILLFLFFDQSKFLSFSIIIPRKISNLLKL